MLSDAPRRRHQKHLINIIADTQKQQPNFTLFLGAGASVLSQVKPAKAMVAEWREKFWSMHGGAEDRDVFFNKFSWHDTHHEYSTLFEELYDQPSQRREYIERCVSCGRPSWGYIYLVNLLKHSIFNTVFTTNFDDLLNEACYLYSDSVRPIVCAHDSSIRYVRISSKRPKIIKLHGDFLFDNIKNTIRELESLEENMRDKFKQCASEYGMIVVGYSGNDRSVMDSLSALLRHDANFPHGIYWCVRKDSKISKQVTELCRFSRFNLVEVEGFDEFFAEVHEHLALPLQPEMADPYSALAEKLNGLIAAANIEPQSSGYRIIRRDVGMLAQKIARLSPPDAGSSSVASGDAARLVPNDATQVSLPYELLAEVERREGRIDGARENIRRQLAARPSLRTYGLAISLLAQEWHEGFSEEVISSLRQNSDLFDDDPNEALEFGVNLITAQRYDYAGRIMDICYERHEKGLTKTPLNVAYFILNKAQAKRHAGLSLSAEETQELRVLVKLAEDHLAQLGAEIVLGQFDDAESRLYSLVNDGLEEPQWVIRILKQWPIFRLFPAEYLERIRKFVGAIWARREGIQEIENTELVLDKIENKVRTRRKKAS